MDLITVSKRPGMDGFIDVYYEQTNGLAQHLNDGSTYKMVLVESGSFVVEENGGYRVITAPVAMGLNERAELNVISESGVFCRTIYFRPTVIREEFTIEAVNSGKYDKFTEAVIEEQPMTGDEKVRQAIFGENRFDASFMKEPIYQDALLLLEFRRYGRDIVYYTLTRQETDAVRRLFTSVRYDLEEQPDNLWILRVRYFIISILFTAVADFYRNWRQDEIYSNPLVAKVTQYFWNNLDREITLASVLKRFSVNKNTLNDAFNSEVSMSCMAYLENLRVNNAKKELQFSSCSVSEVSQMVGYSDTNYFSKVFKKHTGMTPSEFQKTMKGLC